MANGYNQKFTLEDIFNNKKLKGKIPLVNYKEDFDEDNKLHKKTNMKTLSYLVYNMAKSSARPYYNPFTPSKSGDIITIAGTLTDDINKPFEAVYQGILAQKQILSFTVNNGDIIRTALKESKKIGREMGKEPKLWLKVGSMQEIENMNKKQLNYLVDDIMRNIFYNSEYQYTQKKYDVAKIPVYRSTNYELRKLKWQQKVGDYE